MDIKEANSSIDKFVNITATGKVKGLEEGMSGLWIAKVDLGKVYIYIPIQYLSSMDEEGV